MKKNDIICPSCNLVASSSAWKDKGGRCPSNGKNPITGKPCEYRNETYIPPELHLAFTTSLTEVVQ